MIVVEVAFRAMYDLRIEPPVTLISCLITIFPQLKRVVIRSGYRGEQRRDAWAKSNNMALNRRRSSSSTQGGSVGLCCHHHYSEAL